MEESENKEKGMASACEQYYENTHLKEDKKGHTDNGQKKKNNKYTTNS